MRGKKVDPLLVTMSTMTATIKMIPVMNKEYDASSIKAKGPTTSNARNAHGNIKHRKKLLGSIRVPNAHARFFSSTFVCSFRSVDVVVA